MEFFDNKLSDESKDAVAKLITELRELKSTSFALELTIKILKSLRIEELNDRIFKQLDVNATLSNFNKN